MRVALARDEDSGDFDVPPPVRETLPNGTVIAERYRLDARIGQGGSATVWRAYDLVLARAVAVKMLRVRDDESASADRFLREARLAAAIHHPNVAVVLDFGV